MQIPIYYTLVEYEQKDIFGFILALFSLLPIFLIISYVTLILEKPRKVIIIGLFGQLLNEILNSLIKKTLKVQRPFHKGKGYGFRSSHAQFMGYIIGYCMIVLISSRFTKLYSFYFLGLIVGGISTSYSRIYLEYHTLDQVLGLLVGVAVGNIWAKVLSKGFLRAI